jgi:hypothetical protein
VQLQVMQFLLQISYKLIVYDGRPKINFIIFVFLRVSFELKERRWRFEIVNSW